VIAATTRSASRPTPWIIVEDIAQRRLEADEVQPRLGGDDAAFVHRLLLREDGEVDPRESRVEPRAPDDVRHVEDAAVLQHGPAVSHAHGPGHALHARSCQVPGLDPHERPASRPSMYADVASNSTSSAPSGAARSPWESDVWASIHARCP